MLHEYNYIHLLITRSDQTSVINIVDLNCFENLKHVPVVECRFCQYHYHRHDQADYNNTADTMKVCDLICTVVKK